jgi:hypothetical protein
MERRYYVTFRIRRKGRLFDIPTEGLYLRDMAPVELAQSLDEVYELKFRRGIVPAGAARQLYSEIGETLRLEIGDEMVIDKTNTVAKTSEGWILR